jgi:hypothetical protein
MSLVKSSPAFERLMEENRRRDDTSFEEYQDEQYWAERERQERLKNVPSQQQEKPGNSAQ